MYPLISRRWILHLPGACALAHAAGPARAEDAPSLHADTPLRAEDIQADVALLRQAYEALHPGLLRYNTPAQMAQAFDALARRLQGERTLAETWLALSEFTSGIRCGHTYPNFFNQSPAVAAALLQAPRLPWHFRWLAGRMVVTQSVAGDAALRPGTEVLAIDGVPVADILARLIAVGRADGHNVAKRVASLEVHGGSRYEAFDIYWPLYFPPGGALVPVRLRIPGDRAERSIQVPLMAAAARLEAATQALGAPTAGPDAPRWTLDIGSEGVARLRMPSWAVYNTRWDWRAWLDRAFDILIERQVPDLVVDLRGNEGGNNIGEPIASRLIGQPVPRLAVTRLVRYRKVPDALLPFLDTWDPGFRDWGAAATEHDARYYRLRRDGDDEADARIMPKAPRYGGRLWVLVGAANSSATFEFARMVRQNGLGTLVGQTTGGNQRGVHGGAFFFLRLPRTGLEVDLPLIGQFAPGSPPDAGLAPDIPVEPTAEDIAAGRDAELAAVRAAIARTPAGTQGRGAIFRQVMDDPHG